MEMETQGGFILWDSQRFMKSYQKFQKLKFDFEKI